MGANASTAVPLYASGQVLDAARLNLTNSGVPVFSGTATRNAAFGNSGQKVLAEGQLCYLEDSNVVQYYDGANFATVGPAIASGLTLISTTTIGTAVSSVTVSNAFSSTYDNYKITMTGGTASTSGAGRLSLGATTTGYYGFYVVGSYSGTTVTGENNNNTTAGFEDCFFGSTNSLIMNLDLFAPNLAKTTHANWSCANANTAGAWLVGGGFLNDSTQYTAFTLTPTTGTITGGTIRVYGYLNS
jgi:hypothetical protein